MRLLKRQLPGRGLRAKALLLFPQYHHHSHPGRSSWFEVLSRKVPVIHTALRLPGSVPDSTD
jgi:hypothetical protein